MHGLQVILTFDLQLKFNSKKVQFIDKTQLVPDDFSPTKILLTKTSVMLT